VSQVQSRFIRGLELTYADRVAELVADGMDPEPAHQIALAYVKDLGREALDLLRARGLFPWRDDPAPSGLSAEQRALLDAHGWTQVGHPVAFPELMEHIEIMKEFRRRTQRPTEFADTTASAPEDADIALDTPPPEQLSITDYDDAEAGHA